MRRSDAREPEGLLVTCQCRMERRGSHWLASCDGLGVSDHGATSDEARERLLTAIDLFLKDCASRGTLEQVFSSRNIPFLRISMPGRWNKAHRGNRLLTPLAGEPPSGESLFNEQLEILVPAMELGKVHAGIGSD